MIYFENFSLKAFFYALIKGLISFSKKKNKSVHYFFDANNTIVTIINFIGKILNVEFKKIEFKMTQIVDSQGELVWIRIVRKDLFEFEKIVKNSKAFKELFNNISAENDLGRFVIKGLLSPSLQFSDYPQRMLYLINVINWHMKKINVNNSEFIISNRPWFNEYYTIAKKFTIKLHKINNNQSQYRRLKRSLLKIIKSNTRLLIIAKNIKYKMTLGFQKSSFNNEPLLYLEGRGGVNFKNDGKHSDFYWQLNSEFLSKNILYTKFTGSNDILISNGVQIMNKKINYYKTNLIIPRVDHQTSFIKEKEEINKQLLSYESTREYWRCLFKTYNVKIFSTWYIFENDHIAKNNAIRDVGGISIVQQIAFEGHKTYTCSKIADIVLRYSKWNCNLEKEHNSKINYKIITGYPKDYATPLLKKEADFVREKLKKNGAKKIVFVIDENSGYDDRWHTGHGLQRENYSFILNKMMEIPWLGVIFKPKYSKTLKNRLGNDLWNLLIDAENTGRCHIYKDSGDFATIAPPLIGGLSADICIHGHMGNAALECALSNLPTLIIDREKNPHHKFRELPKDKVVFNNWPDTIDALMEHFSNPKGIKGFGDWSNFVNQFDPFRDGKAAFRIGTFKKWLLDGYTEGKSRNIILQDAVDKYANIWGNDKVLINDN